MNKIRNKVIGLGALATALSSGAFASGTSTAPQWAKDLTTTSFDDILTEVAPIALAVVFGVAGVRVAIKLINRGAGK